MDDRPRDPASVIIMSAEDDVARTIVPRLRSAGANLDKVHILESVILDDGTEALPGLRSDLDRIEEAAGSLGDCKLIIIDPVTAYLFGIDDHRNAELRGVLSPLKRLAERLASISTTTFYPNVFVPHGFRIALILWLPRLVALVQRGTDATNFSASIPNPLS